MVTTSSNESKRKKKTHTCVWKKVKGRPHEAVQALALDNECDVALLLDFGVHGLQGVGILLSEAHHTRCSMRTVEMRRHRACK